MLTEIRLANGVNLDEQRCNPVVGCQIGATAAVILRGGGSDSGGNGEAIVWERSWVVPRLSDRLWEWMDAGPWRYCLSLSAVLVCATLIRYGFGVYPDALRMLDLAVHWRDPVSAQWPEDFWVSSPVSAWVAGVLGLSTRRSFLFFHAFIAVFALVWGLLIPRVRRNRHHSQLVFLVLAGGPVGAILLGWIGSYDPVSVLAIVVATLSKTLSWRLLGWLVLAFNHNALSLAALACSVPLLVYAERTRTRTGIVAVACSVIAAVAVGIGLNSLLMAHWGAQTSRMDVFERVGFETFVSLALMTAPLIAFSGLGAGWLIILDRRLRRRPAGTIALVTAIVATCVIPFIALDQSRVLGLALLAPMLLWTCAAAGYPPNLISRVWKTWRVPVLVVPVVLVIHYGFTSPGWSGYLGFQPIVNLVRALPG